MFVWEPRGAARVASPHWGGGQQELSKEEKERLTIPRWSETIRTVKAVI